MFGNVGPLVEPVRPVKQLLGFLKSDPALRVLPQAPAFPDIEAEPHVYNSYTIPQQTATALQVTAQQLLIDLDYCAALDSPIVSSQTLVSCSRSGRRGEVGRLP
jgi:hypothetical protein